MLLLAVPPPVFADELSGELPKSVRDILDEGGTDLSDAARWRFSDLCDTVGAWAAEGLQPALHLAAQSAGYLLLAGLVALYVTRQEKLLTGASPWEVFSRLTALRLPPEGFGVGIALLALILLGMALQPRFFCQFLCPMGAVFALLPVLPFARLLPAERWLHSGLQCLQTAVPGVPEAGRKAVCAAGSASPVKLARASALNRTSTGGTGLCASTCGCRYW